MQKSPEDRIAFLGVFPERLSDETRGLVLELARFLGYLEDAGAVDGAHIEVDTDKLEKDEPERFRFNLTMYPNEDGTGIEKIVAKPARFSIVTKKTKKGLAEVDSMGLAVEVHHTKRKPFEEPSKQTEIPTGESPSEVKDGEEDKDGD